MVGNTSNSTAVISATNLGQDPGLYGTANGNYAQAIRGVSTGLNGKGVVGVDNNGSQADGVYGASDAGSAVYGYSTTGEGVEAYTSSGVGVSVPVGVGGGHVGRPLEHGGRLLLVRPGEFGDGHGG